MGDYTYWQGADRAQVKRINRLNEDALRDPQNGIGKPEPLLVYLVDGDDLVILQARFHYGK